MLQGKPLIALLQSSPRIEASEATLHASGQPPRPPGISVQHKLLYANCASLRHPVVQGAIIISSGASTKFGRVIEEELIDVIQVPCAGVRTPRHGPWVSTTGQPWTMAALLDEECRSGSIPEGSMR